MAHDRNGWKFFEPNDTSYGSGTYTLKTQIPEWADPNNNVWGLSSYSANWQVFGDYGTKFGGISDGLSNTILFNEKFAVSSRDTGDPQQGANLWGYGVLPPSMPCDYTQDLPTDHLYVSAYWARSGFVNRGDLSQRRGQAMNLGDVDACCVPNLESALPCSSA